MKVERAGGLVDDGRVGVYEIGARNGGRHFASPACRLPGCFSTDVFTAFFEADETAAAQIARNNDPARSRVIVACLGEHDGPGTLYINYDPYTSSILRPYSGGDFELNLPKYLTGATDYLLSEACTTVREVPVALRTLDGLAGDIGKLNVPPPTVMFLDTQGSELAIMRGGWGSIESNTVAIVTEAEFIPLYEGQPLFGDLCRELATIGFVFAKFMDRAHAIDPFRQPLGFRNRSFDAYCDALFLRNPKVLHDRPALLARLIFIAHCFGQTSFAFHCSDLLKEIDPDMQAVPEARVYKQFLLDLLSAQKKMLRFFPPSFVDVYPTADASAARFIVDRQTEARETLNENLSRIKARLLQHGDDLTKLLDSSPSPIEAVLKEYEFVQQAYELQQRRLSDINALLAQFGIEVKRSPW